MFCLYIGIHAKWLEMKIKGEYKKMILKESPVFMEIKPREDGKLTECHHPSNSICEGLLYIYTLYHSP